MNWMVWVVLEIWNMKTIMKYELDGVGDMKYEDKKLWKYELDGVGVGDIQGSANKPTKPSLPR